MNHLLVFPVEVVMSVICGIDFSEWSHAAMTAAAAIAGRLNLGLWLVHALEPRVEEMDPAAREKVMGLLHKRLEAEATAAKAYTSGPVHVHVAAGRADEVLRATAKERAGTLLVIGSAGHGATALARLGGTSERLATANPVPVLVVRDEDPFSGWGPSRPLKALVGLDESPASASAVRWLERLRKTAPVDVVVGRVYYADEAHRHYGLGRRFSFTDPDPQVESLIERDLKKLVPHLEGKGELFYRARLGVGRIADHLLELAEAERCNLVVVGSHGRTGLARMWSVSAAALHLGRMAVAVVPPDGQEPSVAFTPAPQLGRVLVATDFSAVGNTAIPWAYTLADHGAEVLLAHVTLTQGGASGDLLEQYLPGVAPAQQPRSQVESEVAARLRALTPKVADAKHIVTRTHVLRGSEAARTLIDAAERLGVDAIVIASHGKGGLARTMLGSVSHAVLAGSLRPVFVVRQPVP